MMTPMPLENDRSPPPFPGVFDLSSAEGVNESERLLMRLCRKSFLSLWAHANLHTAQDMHEGKGSAKEFADVLVVFGDDVIIFSDKHIAFQEDKDLKIAWPRWFKRAVTESAKQLHGAMSWLRRCPDRIFLDAACKRPLPIVLPAAERARYHLVAVTRGSRQACLKAFADGLGTLQINSSIEGRTHEQAAFTIGVLDRSKHFVHVLDEFSLEVVMDEVDTITDFVQYLVAREAFLSDASMTVMATGEEQLMAVYISQGDDSEHDFLPDGIGPERPDLVMYDDSHYSGLKKRPEYVEKKLQDERSRAWDEMLERLIRLGDPRLVHKEVNQPNHETEQGLRLMAAEPRFRRHLLTEALVEMLAAAAKEPKKRRARLFTTHEQPDLVYIFLVTPKLQTETDDEYRRARVAMLYLYCRSAKLKFPKANTFIGLGLDHPAKDYDMSSEDVIVFTCDEYTSEQRAEVEKFRREFGILGSGLTTHNGYATEFPSLRPLSEPGRSSTQSPKRDRKKDKRKAKASQSSKRRNRR
ncbi:hypothetical protein [Paracidovorax cattleyae]|uniref:Uncharacterized protein n=1 Tax=Paracidovorax cattleyae TaxID=80868 RepID=A0A1H0USR3_9BURK|nr:hypothetical protein [Paracidovorax cattleyae]SDP69171.1 hypothetical protein SAMN04489708_12182 [Paracidovorax cattleyae]